MERPLSSEDDDFCHYFPHLWYCYEQFWEGQDDFPKQWAELGIVFEEKTRHCEEETQALQEEEIRKSTALMTLKQTEPPLNFERNENEVLENDVKKFVEYIKVALQPRIKQFDNSINAHLRESEISEENIRKAKKEKSIYQEQVDAQNVSADDFEQMSREREHLAEETKLYMDRRQEHSTSNNYVEVSLSNMQSRAEEGLKNLSDNCRDVDILPLVLLNGARLYDFDIVAGNSETMLPKGLDLKGSLSRVAMEKRDAYGAKYRTMTHDKIREQEDYDLLLEEMDEYRDGLSQADTKLRSAKEQNDLAHATFKEESRLQDEGVANAEMALAQLEQSGRVNIDVAESRAQAARMQINLIRDQDQTLRREMHQRYVAGLETVLSLKSLVSEGLKSLEEAAINHSKKT